MMLCATAGAVSVTMSVTATADEVPPALVAVKLGVKLLAAHGMPLSIPVVVMLQRYGCVTFNLMKSQAF